MANKYWRLAATGDYATAANWSLSSGGPANTTVPTAADSVFFDLAGTYSVTVNGNSCLDITVSAGSVTFVAGATAQLSISGSMSLSASTVWGSTLISLFVASTSGRTITTNGVVIGPVTINAASLGISLGSALTTSNTSALQLSQGALNLNGFDLTTGTFVSSFSTARSIAFGDRNIILTNPNANLNVVNIATQTLFTCTQTTGGFVTNATVNRIFLIGTQTVSSDKRASSPNITITGSGAGTLSFTTGSDSCWVRNIDFGTHTGTVGASTSLKVVGGVILSATGTYTPLSLTIVGNSVSAATIDTKGLTIAGFNVDAPAATVTLASNIVCPATFAMALTAGTLNLNNYNITTGTFTSSNSNTREINFGSGTITTTYTVANTVCVNIATATGFTCTQTTGGFRAQADITRTYRVGSGGGGSVAGAPSLALTGSGTAIQTFATGSWFNTLNFGTTSFDIGTIGLNLSTLILSSGGTYTNLTVTMTGTGSINTQGKTINIFNVNMTTNTSTCTLQSAVTTGSTTNTITQGNLVLNGFTLTVGILSSSNTNIRSIDFGTGASASNIVLASASGTSLQMADITNLTCIGTGAIAASMGGSRTFTCGSTAGGIANAPNLSLTSGAAIATFTYNLQGSFFKTLNFTGYTGTPATNTEGNFSTLILGTGGNFVNLAVTMVGTGTINTNGNTTLSGFILGSGRQGGCNTTLLSSVTTTATGGVTHGPDASLNLNGFTLTTGSFSTLGTTTKSLAFGNSNIVLAHTTAGTTVLGINLTNFTITAGTGGFTSSAAITRTYSVTGTAGTIPSNGPNLTLTGSGTAVQTISNDSYFNVLNFGTTAFSIPTIAVNVNNIVLSTGGNFLGLVVNMLAAGTLTTNNKHFGGLNININTGTITLGSALTVNGTTTITAGTLDLAGFTMTTLAGLTSSSSSARSITGAGTLVVTGNWSVSDGTNFTGNNYTINMISASGKTFGGGGGSYGNLVQAGSGALTISGSNQFNDITATTRPSTISFTAGTTQTLTNFTLSGTAGNLVTINSVTSGTQFNLLRTSGTSNVNYLSIQDSNASAAFFANNTSVNVSNNKGWNFTFPAVVQSGFASFF